MIDFTLAGKKIVVTGASSGIGRAIALSCAEAGADVIVMGRCRERLEECVSAFPYGIRSSIVTIDFNELHVFEEMEPAIANVVAKLGKIDGFVHSAGSAYSRPLRVTQLSDFLTDYQLNVAAGFGLAGILSKKKYLNPAGASFVFISSVTARIGTAGKCSYSATKGALLSGARALAAELCEKKIRINTVSPGYVANTGITRDDLERLTEEGRQRIERDHPLGIGEPDNIAGPVVFLLSDAAKWITGSDLCIDGGYGLRR